MTFCDLTLPTPEENLACDEALLDMYEDKGGGGVLRFWEPASYFVVVGYANEVAAEVNVDFCRANNLPILRRCTGGGTVLQGPGCLNYSLVLPIVDSCESIAATNRFVMQRHQKTITELLGIGVEWQGQTDLAINGLKFSGNAQRRKRRFLLFHGTFLVGMDIELIENALMMPARQPDYRQNRRHSEFLVNLTSTGDSLKDALYKAWDASELLSNIPGRRIGELVEQKYGRPEWIVKF